MFDTAALWGNEGRKNSKPRLLPWRRDEPIESGNYVIMVTGACDANCRSDKCAQLEKRAANVGQSAPSINLRRALNYYLRAFMGARTCLRDSSISLSSPYLTLSLSLSLSLCVYLRVVKRVSAPFSQQRATF
jgi:hypothetical protein